MWIYHSHSGSVGLICSRYAQGCNFLHHRGHRSLGSEVNLPFKIIIIIEKSCWSGRVGKWVASVRLALAGLTNLYQIIQGDLRHILYFISSLGNLLNKCPVLLLVLQEYSMNKTKISSGPLGCVFHPVCDRNPATLSETTQFLENVSNNQPSLCLIRFTTLAGSQVILEASFRS